MKSKIAIIIFLALLLIGVAYIKALFSHQDRDRSLSGEAIGKIPSEMVDDYIKKDETVRTLDSLRLFYADSLDKITNYWSDTIDPLSQAMIDSLQCLVEQLKENVGEAENNVRKAKEDKTIQFERLVKAFYDGELAQLPADLSQYERDVSINEIKNKATEYFDVSLKTLDRIIKK